MTRILVTGHAGFIGFHTTRRLIAEGHHVTGIDSVNAYYDSSLKRARLAQLEAAGTFNSYEFDIADYEKLEKTFADAKPEIVIHLAAQAGVRYSIDHPESYLSSNLVGSFNLLEAARAHPVRHLMLASSSSVYGMNEKLPFAETDRADEPVSLYAATKKSMESLAHSYAHLYQIPTTAFRFFTVYGPWGRPDMALFKFVRAMEAGEPIDVYGEGRMLRDFTYVDDLVEGITRLADTVPLVGSPAGPEDSLSHVAPYRVVNLGGGSPVGLLQFIEAIENALGKKAVCRFLPMQPGDVARTSADQVLLRKLIGTMPSTPVESGVAEFVHWWRGFQSHLDQPVATASSVT